MEMTLVGIGCIEQRDDAIVEWTLRCNKHQHPSANLCRAQTLTLLRVEPNGQRSGHGAGDDTYQGALLRRQIRL